MCPSSSGWSLDVNLPIEDERGLEWHSFVRLRKLGIFMGMSWLCVAPPCHCTAIIALGQIHGTQDIIVQSPHKKLPQGHTAIVLTLIILKEIVLVASTAYHQTNYPSVLTVPQSGFPGVHQTLLSQRILCGCVDDGRELRQCWWWIFHCH